MHKKRRGERVHAIWTNFHVQHTKTLTDFFSKMTTTLGFEEKKVIYIFIRVHKKSRGKGNTAAEAGTNIVALHTINMLYYY